MRIQFLGGVEDVRQAKPRKVCLVYGEPGQREALAEALRAEKLAEEVLLPSNNDMLELG